jgi:hypothetical protein
MFHEGIIESRTSAEAVMSMRHAVFLLLLTLVGSIFSGINPVFSQEPGDMINDIRDDKRPNSADTMNCFGVQPTILGTEGDDTLRGTGHDDIISGLAGNDKIFGSGGNDMICGGPGADIIHTDDGNDRAFGGRGNDELAGGSGNDKLWGGTGWDKLFGQDGDDVIFGGVGNDVLEGEEGTDILDGQEGIDILDGIKENNPEPDLPPDIQLYVGREYEPGDFVNIEAFIEPVDDDIKSVLITVTAPNGNSKQTKALLQNGYAEHHFTLDDDASDGIYTVEVKYDTYSLFDYFLVDEEADEIDVATDANIYEQGDDVEISGLVIDPEIGENSVRITVMNPDGESILQQEIDLDGHGFDFVFDLDQDAPIGSYAVKVLCVGGQAGWMIFEVEEVDPTEEIDAFVAKHSYHAGDNVIISGSIDDSDVEAGQYLTLSVLGPDHGVIISDHVTPYNDGSFDVVFALDNNVDDGYYYPILSYFGYVNKTLVFEVKPAAENQRTYFDLKVSGIAKVPDGKRIKELDVATVIDGGTKFGSYLDSAGAIRERNTLTAGYEHVFQGNGGFFNYFYTEVEDLFLVNWINVTGTTVELPDGRYNFTLYAVDDLEYYGEYLQMFLRGTLAEDKMTIESMNGIIAAEYSDSLVKCDVRLSDDCYPDYHTGLGFEDTMQMRFALNSEPQMDRYIDGVTHETRVTSGSLGITQVGTAEFSESVGFLEDGDYKSTTTISSAYLLRPETGQVRVLYTSGEMELNSPHDNVGFDLGFNKFNIAGDRIDYSMDEMEVDDGFLSLSGIIAFPQALDFMRPFDMLSNDGEISMQLTDWDRQTAMNSTFDIIGRIVFFNDDDYWLSAVSGMNQGTLADEQVYVQPL